MTNFSPVLKSGIHELDSLFHIENPTSGPPEDALTTCIIGPDGTGKSLLAMHFAAAHLYECLNVLGKQQPLVIYASTDFSATQAQMAWQNFGLEHPQHRSEALRTTYQAFRHWNRRLPSKAQLGFEHVVPLDKSELPSGEKATALSSVLKKPDNYRGKLLFLDLQKESSGDDWTSLNHILGLLGKTSNGCHRPLLLVDAVEGLETFVGSRDAHGERRPRRSRVAQLSRTCVQSGSHLLLVIEEAIQNRRLPEQFVSDVVIRLRKEPRGNETVRTIEVEKCRGCGHISGPNDYYIRRGTGTSTGKHENWDHPNIPWRKRKRDEKQSGNLSHFHIVPSIECVDAGLRINRDALPIPRGRPSFGIEELDDQFPHHGNIDPQKCEHLGSTSVLLGESGTLKSRLAINFLSEAFNTESAYYKEHGPGIAIMVTNAMIDTAQLKEEIASIARITRSVKDDMLLVRRLTSRYISAAQFLQVVITHVKAAKRVLDDRFSTPSDSRSGYHRIRLVIDDWNLILASHPSIQQNTLLLPTLLSLLQREGISTLIVSTDSVKGGALTQFPSPNDLRKLDIPQIHTWSVPFFGERLVAISTIAPRHTTRHPEVYELRYDPSDSEQPLLPSSKGSDRPGRRLRVDRHFALYTGLETSNPRRVPLVIRLYGGPHTGHGSAEKPEKAAFPRALSQMLGQLFPARPEHDVVKFEPFSTYDDFFAFANWLDEARLDHTVVFQIDEFWTSSKESSLAPLQEYWNRNRVERHDGKRNDGEDVYDVFQRHDVEEGENKTTPGWIPRITRNYHSSVKKGNLTRSDTFYGLDFGAPDVNVDRVPFLWDFGMILARKDLWMRAYQTSPSDSAEIILRVWNSLCREGDQIGDKRPYKRSRIVKSVGFDATLVNKQVSWWSFFNACRLVAKCAPDENVVPFDVDNNTAESLSCLLLEIWASYAEKGFMSTSSRMPPVETCLRDLLDQHWTELFLASEQLLSVTGHFRGRSSTVERNKCKLEFVASREWYSTSSAIMAANPDHHYSVLSLPGSFATRGDWFLAVAKGSRSRLLGQRAIDLLSSRRLGLLRTQDGLGLPVRDILPDSKIGQMKSAITQTDPTTGQIRYLEYGEVAALRKPRCGEELKWLWRSKLDHYDRDSFFWRRWIARLYEDQKQWHPHDYMDIDKQSARIAEVLQKKRDLRDFDGSGSAFSGQIDNFLRRVQILKSAIWPKNSG